jgi:hypothetical protein
MRRCAFADRTSQFLNPTQHAFYEGLLEEIGLDYLRFSVLELNGKPIAYHLGFETEGKYIFYKPTFDVDLWDHSPGTVLLLNLLEYIQESSVRELDFALGGEWYKSRFTNYVRSNKKIIFYRSKAVASIARLSIFAKGGVHALGASNPLLAPVALLKRHVQRHQKDPIKKDALLPELEIRSPIGGDVYLTEFRKLLKNRYPIEVYDDLDIRSGNLSDLADLAVAFPSDWPAERLHNARARMKSEKLLVAEANGEIKDIAWLRPVSV